MPPQTTVVLLVEDEPFIRISTAESLKDAGFYVLEAETAGEAIALIESRSDVRIVFTDVNLADAVDGIELLHLIADRWPPIRLFATSGATRVEASDLPQGAAFFPKPYDQTAVVEAFRTVLKC